MKNQVFKKMKAALSLGLVATLFASCASGPGGSPISSANYVAPPESTYKKIKFQSTAVGAVGGALLAGGIAKLTGASNKQAAAAAVAGGVVGGVAGHEVGKKQAAKVKAESEKNTALAGSVKDLKSTNSQLASYNRSLRSKLANMDAATAKANRKQLDKVINTQRSNLSNAQNQIAKNKGSKDAKALATQVERLRSEVSSLDKTRAKLLKAEQGTRV